MSESEREEGQPGGDNGRRVVRWLDVTQPEGALAVMAIITKSIKYCNNFLRISVIGRD